MPLNQPIISSACILKGRVYYGLCDNRFLRSMEIVHSEPHEETLEWVRKYGSED